MVVYKRKDFSGAKFLAVSKEALVPAAIYVRKAINGDIDLGEALVKQDKTAVTIVDTESQRLSRPKIREGFPGARFYHEESAGVTEGDSNIIVYHDPLDGTGGFLVGGPTPTIILGVYDVGAKEVLGVATMEPSTGRMWYSARGDGTHFNVFDYHGERWVHGEDGKPCQVNQGQADLKGATVLVDVTHGFSRKLPDGSLREILTQSGRDALNAAIVEEGAKAASFYTNGGHYALTSFGRPTLAGNITTAIGGPFDVAGLLHVTEAGGFGTALEIEEDGWTLRRTGEAIDTADLVVAANTAENLDRLVAMLQEAGRNI